MSFLTYTTKFQGPADIFLRDPKRYLPFAQLLADLMDDESQLSTIEREMVALYVSKLNHCIFCTGTHRAVLTSLNVSTFQIDAVENGQSDESRIAAMLAFAKKLSLTAGEISADDIADLVSQGLTEQAVEDLINVVSLFSYLNRLLDGLGITGAEPVYQQVGAMVAKQGYGPVLSMVQAKAA